MNRDDAFAKDYVDPLVSPPDTVRATPPRLPEFKDQVQNVVDIQDDAENTVPIVLAVQDPVEPPQQLPDPPSAIMQQPDPSPAVLDGRDSKQPQQEPFDS